MNEKWQWSPYIQIEFEYTFVRFQTQYPPIAPYHAAHDNNVRQNDNRKKEKCSRRRAKSVEVANQHWLLTKFPERNDDYYCYYCYFGPVKIQYSLISINKSS